MLTNITGVFRLSKVGDLGDELLEELSSGNLSVGLQDFAGNIIPTSCDDLLISKVSVEDDDGFNEACLKNDLLEYYKHINTQDVSDIHMVILNGIRYQVFKINSTVHMINGLTNELEFTVPSEKLVTFLKSKDELYSTYKRVNKFL